MTPNRRSRAIGIATAVAAIPFLFPTAAFANASLGSSNEPTKPPAPGACAGYLWQAADMHTHVQLSKTHPRYVIPGLHKEPGSIDVTEAVTYDVRRTDEDDELDLLTDEDESTVEKVAPKPTAEKFEKMRVEFWAGDRLLGSTPAYTPDLEDDAPYAWAVTPLGRTDIFEEADRVELVHASQWMKTDDQENAFFPVSVCFTWSPLVTDNSVAAAVDCDSATITLRNDGTAKGHVRVTVNGANFDYLVTPYGGTIDKEIALAEDGTTDITVTDLDSGEVLWAKKWTTDCVVPSKVEHIEATPTTTASVPTAVLGTQVTAAPQADVLAFTGSDATAKAGLGAALLALGAGLLTVGRRRKAVEA